MISSFRIYSTFMAPDFQCRRNFRRRSQ